MKRIDLIAGARPNFVKIASVLGALEGGGKTRGVLRARLVHTGQHYDRNMSDTFFSQLNIREPDVNLQVGSGSHARQTAAIMVKYEELLDQAPCDICLVVGDVNSTLATALVAKKRQILVAHVEAGIRSGDLSMPEEINRMATDAITDLFFTTSRSASQTLLRLGAHHENVHFVGNTMIDTLLANEARLRPPGFWNELALQPQGYAVLTLHRPANVDDREALRGKLERIGSAARGLPVVFPVHPRVRALLPLDNALPANLRIVEPQPYLEFNHLVKHARMVLTDSGGITEETTVFGVPCMTLRDNTERPETIDTGTNELIGADLSGLDRAMDRLFAGAWKTGAIPELWDGRAGQRIADIVRAL